MIWSRPASQPSWPWTSLVYRVECTHLLAGHPESCCFAGWRSSPSTQPLRAAAAADNPAFEIAAFLLQRKRAAEKFAIYRTR